VQGTAEGHPLRRDELDQLLELASRGTARLFELQSLALSQALAT
jgi:ribonuclease PH